MRTSRVLPALRLTKPGQIASDVLDKSESCILIPRRLDRHLRDSPHFCDGPRVLDYLTDTTPTRRFTTCGRSYVTLQAGLASQNLSLRQGSPNYLLPSKKLHLLRPPRVLSARRLVQKLPSSRLAASSWDEPVRDSSSPKPNCRQDRCRPALARRSQEPRLFIRRDRSCGRWHSGSQHLSFGEPRIVQGRIHHHCFQGQRMRLRITFDGGLAHEGNHQTLHGPEVALHDEHLMHFPVHPVRRAFDLHVQKALRVDPYRLRVAAFHGELEFVGGVAFHRLYSREFHFR